MKIETMEQLHELRLIIGEATFGMCKFTLERQAGDTIWFFQTIAELESCKELTGSQKELCQKQFNSGQTRALVIALYDH